MPDHNPLHTFAPHDLAGMFDVSVMTIRRWAEYHAEHLSDGANPTAGQSRRFTWADVETMRQIKALRDSGLSVEAINAKLTEANVPANTAVTVPVSVAPVPAAQEGPEASQLPVMVLESLQKRIEAIETNHKTNVAQHGLAMFALGFCAACLLFFILVYLISIYSR